MSMLEPGLTSDEAARRIVERVRTSKTAPDAVNGTEEHVGYGHGV